MLCGISPALERCGNECLYCIGVALCKFLCAEDVILKHCNSLIVHINYTDLIAVVITAVIAVLDKTELVICHCRCQCDSILIYLIHCEVHCNIICGQTVL